MFKRNCVAFLTSVTAVDHREISGKIKRKPLIKLSLSYEKVRRKINIGIVYETLVIKHVVLFLFLRVCVMRLGVR